MSRNPRRKLRWLLGGCLAALLAILLARVPREAAAPRPTATVLAPPRRVRRASVLACYMKDRLWLADARTFVEMARYLLQPEPAPAVLGGAKRPPASA